VPSGFLDVGTFAPLVPANSPSPYEQGLETPRNSAQAPYDAAQEVVPDQKEHVELDVDKAGAVDDDAFSAHTKKGFLRRFRNKKRKAKKDKPEKAPAVSFRTLWRYASTKDKIRIAIGSVFAVVNGAVLPAFCYLFGKLLDDLATGDSSMVATMAMWMAIVGGLTWLMAGGSICLFAISGERQARQMRRTFFASILRQETAFFDDHKPGELTSRVSSDVQIVTAVLGSKMAQLIQHLSSVVFSYVFAFVQSWRLSLIMLAVMPIIVIVGAFMAKFVTESTTVAQEVYAAAGAVAQEVLSSIRTVHAFNGTKRESERYNKRVLDAEKIGIKKGIFLGLSQGAINGLLFCSYAVAFYYGSYLIEWGFRSGGEIVSVFLSLLIGAFELGASAPIFTAITEAQGAAYNIFAIVDRDPAMDSRPEAPGAKLDQLRGHIEFRNVAFTYPSRKELPIFNDFNLEIKPGQTVALVGPSGSGKSSVVSLIERFYDLDSGMVLIDGVPLTDLNLHWWRTQVGIVTQEPTLFSATVMENILCANENATEEDVIQACKDAYIYDVISNLPDKFNTQVGEAGSQLSGGQKQRIAIARAIIKNPKILLLDEATSALDRGSEVVVQEALQNVMRGRTVLTIAHRLVTIMDADNICFIQPRDPTAPPNSPEAFSRVLEHGTHDELMSLEGEYKQMVLTQSQAAQAPASPTSPTKDATFSASGADFSDIVEDSVDANLLEEKEKQKEEDEEMTALQLLKRTAKYNKPEVVWVILGTLASAIAGMVYPLYAVFFSEIVNVFYKPIPEMRDEVWKWCLLFTGLGCMSLLTYLVKIYSLNRAGEKLTARLRVLLFRALLRQDIGFFDMPGNESGALCARLASDTTEIQHVFGGAIGTNVQAFVNLIAGMIIGFVVCWQLALVTCAVVPALVGAGILNTKFMFGLEKKSGQSNDKAGQVANESISGNRIVHAFNLQQHSVDRYNGCLEGPAKAAFTKSLVEGFFFGFSQFVIFGAFALSYWYGGQLVEDGVVDFTGVIKCSMALLMGAMGAGEAYSMAGDQAGAVTAANRIYRLLDTVPKIDAEMPDDVGVHLDNVTGFGSFKDVKFNYPSRPDVRILKQLNLDFAAGQRIAILGSTGCGKSTIISLLMRYYDPRAGEVCAEGHNINQLNLPNWRTHCGIVQQEPILFDDTVRGNIKYGRPDAPDEEMYIAAKRANIHDLIMSLPLQYDTNVGAKGSQLSGGQKQRVAIARSIILKPSILLLDEATSALDNVSEKEVQAALDEIIETDKMTVLTVAHRLSTIRNCDTIVVMDQGKILEAGSHEELYELGGDYRRRYDQYYGPGR
jgi:ABC-type multidrug transport system fused ATPase/permease subunit